MSFTVFFRVLFSLFPFLIGACSSNPYKNKKFEESRQIRVEISNSHIGQRNIDAFAKFSFTKEDFLGALESITEYSKKSGQYSVWQDTLSPLKRQIEQLTVPGHYQLGQGFHGRTSLVGQLIDKGHGSVCCDKSSNKAIALENLELAAPTQVQKKAHALFTAEPIKYKKYYKLPSGDRIWPWLPINENAFGE